MKVDHLSPSWENFNGALFARPRDWCDFFLIVAFLLKMFVHNVIEHDRAVAQNYVQCSCIGLSGWKNSKVLFGTKDI